jgi:hypothetical protein
MKLRMDGAPSFIHCGVPGFIACGAVKPVYDRYRVDAERFYRSSLGRKSNRAFHLISLRSTQTNRFVVLHFFGSRITGRPASRCEDGTK